MHCIVSSRWLGVYLWYCAQECDKVKRENTWIHFCILRWEAEENVCMYVWMDHPKVNKSQVLPGHSFIIPMPILQKQERGHSKNEVSSCYLVSILAHKIFILSFEYPFYSKWTKKIKSTIKWRDYRCGKLYYNNMFCAIKACPLYWYSEFNIQHRLFQSNAPRSTYSEEKPDATALVYAYQSGTMRMNDLDYQM